MEEEIVFEAVTKSSHLQAPTSLKFKMTDLQQALLTQKIEFLQLELAEAQQRENNLRSLNDSLMNFLHHSDQPDDSLGEVDRLKEQQAVEIKALKKQHQTSTAVAEQEQQTLRRTLKELELNLKQAQVIAEREKLELLQKVQHLESDKLSLEHALYSLQSDSV
jgi:hypothetical protein